MMKKNDTKKVVRKITFSKPLRVKEDELPPKLVPIPPPLDWIKTRAERIIERII